MDECSHSGCIKPPFATGLCAMHYNRKRRGVPMDKPEERRGLSHADRFWQYVDRRGPDDCWEWTASRQRQGYGQFVDYRGNKKRTVLASRMALELHLGRPLVGQALHHCDNPPCCNPAHLYEGTHADNMRDRTERDRGYFKRGVPNPAPARGVGNGNAKLTEDDVRSIRRDYAAGGVSQQQLADQYGIGQGRISAVIRRATWAHVE